MSFEAAVANAAPPLDRACRPGIQALKGAHRQKVRCNAPLRLTGSIDVDSALAATPEHRTSPRWDYGIGYRPVGGEERAIWIEVHPADTSNVREVLRKRDWLLGHLATYARRLNAITVADARLKPFVWLSTNGTRITPNTPQARALRQAGFDLPRATLHLP